MPGADTRSATYPVDDIHQARITKGVGGWGMTFGEEKNEDRCLPDLLFLFEFRSFRSVRSIAGRGGVIGPLSRPNSGGRTTGEKLAKKADFFCFV